MDSSVEHIISLAMVNATDYGPCGKSRCSDNFYLKVGGTSEYLPSDSKLKEFEYVHVCMKYDKDVEFTLVPIDQVYKPFLRTVIN